MEEHFPSSGAYFQPSKPVPEEYSMAQYPRGTVFLTTQITPLQPVFHLGQGVTK